MAQETVAERRKSRKVRREKSYQRTANEELGCCFSFLSWCVYLIHFTDFFFGLGILIYGLMISATLTGAETIPVLFIIGGLLLIASSSFGFLGKKTDMCKRVGLLISSYLAVPIAISEVAIGFIVVIGKDTIKDFMNDNKEDLYMTKDSINSFGDSVGVIFAVCIICAFIEFCRFYMLRKIRDDLLEYDAMEYESDLAEALNPDDDATGDDQERVSSDKNRSVSAKKKWGFGRSKNSKVGPDNKHENSRKGLFDPYEDKSAKTNLTDSTGFNPVDESLHTDSLWWAKSNTLDDDKDMSWLNEV